MPIPSSPSAIVSHRHDLSLRTYGASTSATVGAPTTSTPARGGWTERVRPDLALLGGRSVDRSRRSLAASGQLASRALLVLWQVANAAGYLWQRMRARHGPPGD